ncbi:hypothetical protein PAXINDRAFT_6933 [Paxillus involutus ATCC 200175]|nr:hypothetical protein PAXINDRAFT_6933 [Paxillus involutus ATCC 200175]
MATTSTSADTNHITRLRKHPKNPQGIFYTTPICSASRCGDHDHTHCFSPGGGMEGQAPWQQKKKKKKKDGTPSGTPTPTASPAVSCSSLPVISAAAVASTFPTSGNAFLGDLSCVSIEPLDSGILSLELAAHVHSALSTILDSGTTTTLIWDRAHFWSFSQDSSPTVHTANHGFLATSSQGDCMAILTVSGVKRCIRFSNCLHAPDAMLNLLSVGWMLNKGWECNFKGNPSHCDLVYRGHGLGSLPLSSSLVEMSEMPNVRLAAES